MSDSAQERTEKPTAKKLKDARERGQIARSRDLAMAAASVAATIALASLGGRLIGGLQDRLSNELSSFGDDPLRVLNPNEFGTLIAENVATLAMLVGPIALCTMIAAVGTHGFQGGWSFAPGALNLNWSRLNPASGVKRLGFSRSGVETIKAMISATAIAYFTWRSIEAILLQSVQLPWMTPGDAARTTWGHAESLLWRAAITLGALALADYGWQHYQHTKSLKMSRQEVRDEHKQNEGSGEVKGKIRQLQHAMSKKRMLADVRTATVVITNPTHYAVALEYRRESMIAPRVVAMGKDHMAKRIREEATKHGVPLVENKPLAQALYATAEIGQTIPAALFAAVAEVLAYLIRIKRLML
jgi:flagellar biosynthesis protein FlhB